MSHIATVQTQLRDPTAIAAACRRLGLAPPAQGVATLYSGEAAGQIVQLPDWHYPVVIDTTSGVAHYDNYEGRWGENRHFDLFIQAYAIEKARIEATRQGYPVTETLLADGSIRLQIQEGG